MAASEFVDILYFYVTPCIEVLFYILHFLILVVLIRKRKTVFNSPFFTIFKILITADLVHFIAITGLRRLADLGVLSEFFRQPNYFATIVINLTSYIAFVQFIGNALLSFNRLTLLWNPIKHLNIWKIQWYTVAILALPALNVVYRMHILGIYSLSKNGIAFLSLTDTKVMALVFQINSIVFVTATCLEGIFTVLSIVKYWSIRGTADTKIKKHEIRLLFISCIIFVGQLLRSVYSFTRPYFESNPDITETLAKVFPLIADICNWSKSISLIILSSSARTAFKSFYWGHTSEYSSSVHVIPATNNHSNK